MISRVNCKSCLTHEFIPMDVESINFSNGSIAGILTDASVVGNIAIIDGLLSVSDGTVFTAIVPQVNANIEIFEHPECDGSFVALICPKNPNLNMQIDGLTIQPCGNREIISYNDQEGFGLIKSPSYNFPECGTCLLTC